MHDSTDTPTIEPRKAAAGDSWRWKITEGHYKASAGWSLKYYFVGDAGTFSFTSSADGDDHLIDLTPADTAEYPAGYFEWVAYADDGTDRYKVRSGTLEVEPDFAALGASDRRSHVKRVLDAIEAAIERRATKTQLAQSIDGVSLSHMPHAELLAMRTKYLEWYRQEQAAERIARGERPRGKKILARFG